MNQFDYDPLIHSMQISRDLRRSSLGLDGSETERHRTRRSLMSIQLMEKKLGEEAGEVTRWLFSRAKPSRLIMADIFDGLPIPSSSMADEYAVEYIDKHIITFRWLYSYILYGDPEIERSYTEEEYQMSLRFHRDYENTLLEGMLSGSEKDIKRRGIVVNQQG